MLQQYSILAHNRLIMRLLLISLSKEVGCLKSSKSSTRAGSTLIQQNCLVGSQCSHAILTEEIGVYRCPFGECFKKLENQKRGAS